MGRGIVQKCKKGRRTPPVLFQKGNQLIGKLVGRIFASRIDCPAVIEPVTATTAARLPHGVLVVAIMIVGASHESIRPIEAARGWTLSGLMAQMPLPGHQLTLALAKIESTSGRERGVKYV